MIEFDEDDVAYARCTCLDRARIALEQTGQVHCAGVMGELQKQMDHLATWFYGPDYVIDPNDPVGAIEVLRRWGNAP